MTKDEIIQMALASGWPEWWFDPPESERQNGEGLKMLERFAALVEAKVKAEERSKLHPKRLKSIEQDDYCHGDERYYSNE